MSDDQVKRLSTKGSEDAMPSSDGADIEQILADDSPRVIDHKAERALVWTFDLRCRHSSGITIGTERRD